MKANYRHQKKLKEQSRLTRRAEKLQRRTLAKAVESKPPAQEPEQPAKPTT